VKGKGYEVVPQLGVAGFRIDIAVRHPDYKSVFLAANECDGASYHSGVTVRDRDRIRQEILEGLGWRGRIWRIWSTDWFRNPQSEAERLFSFLDELRSVPLPVGESYNEVAEDNYEAELQTSDESTAAKLELSELVLETADDEIEVRVGDLVTYFNIESPELHLSVQITTTLTDLNQGLIGEGTPLAQVLLGSTTGDEVVLRVPGKAAATLCIHEVNRKELAQPELA
jgi:transcription elongation GreA/GreB family factor/very-short-patch-repair endonuclease